VLVKLFATFQALGAGSKLTIAVPDGATVADALEALFAEAPLLRAHILQPGTQELQQHVNIMVNGRLIRDLQGLDTRVRNSDPLAIFPPVAGG
jgi:molybdopterin synthase sulfur carrier subunit